MILQQRKKCFAIDKKPQQFLKCRKKKYVFQKCRKKKWDEKRSKATSNQLLPFSVSVPMIRLGTQLLAETLNAAQTPITINAHIIMNVKGPATS